MAKRRNLAPPRCSRRSDWNMPIISASKSATSGSLKASSISGQQTRCALARSPFRNAPHALVFTSIRLTPPSPHGSRSPSGCPAGLDRIGRCTCPGENGSATGGQARRSLDHSRHGCHAFQIPRRVEDRDVRKQMLPRADVACRKPRMASQALHRRVKPLAVSVMQKRRC